MKNTNTGFQHLINSTKYSLQGLGHAIKNEAAFRQELILVGVLFISSFFISEGFLSWCLLIFPLFLLLIVELLNSAIEAVVDRIGEEFHKLSGMAKDMGSAAVFLNLVFIAIVWVGYILYNFVLVEEKVGKGFDLNF
ncbi:MAG: diacylglycerol kinase [Cyclobacteriaceae bacterium]|nr:diacylglycerol kinase [Cyclobacteriaceae bacterium]